MQQPELIEDWRADSIVDETYRTKFMYLPNIIEDWLLEYGGLQGKELLDFGCGEATTAIGMALRKRPKRIVGVEIQPNLERCLPLAQAQLRLSRLPDNLELRRIEPGTLHDPRDRFDLIYSWSVFEHIERGLLPRVFAQLRGALKPNGLLFVQIAPLYYSAEGSHMLPWIPEPWAHLLDQHSVYCDRLRAGTRDDAEFQSLWSTYRTLNRVTADELVALARGARFQVLRDYRTKDEREVPARLLAVYQRDVVTTNQVVLLLKPVM
jgi:cyclopropane fatty-acyl-phospholipid synthase-like methyltransferase